MQRLPIRTIRVTDVRRVTPHMARVTFGGPDLTDLAYDEPDQQVKLYFPRPGQDAPRLPDAAEEMTRWYQAFAAMPDDERPWMRSYTLRHHDRRAGTVDIDFAVHANAGPATQWALSARPGDTLAMFGPSAMFARPTPLSADLRDAGWVLMAGDESALPAIGTLIEALPEGARATAFVEVRDAAEEQRFATRGELTVHWLHRGATPAGASDALVEAVRDASLPAGPVFAWLGGEAGTVRALRRHLLNERGVDRRSVDFTGYWRRRLSQDDAPTEEDLADAQERLAQMG